MMVGKMENTSASYIDPTADVMRAPSERTAQTKQDAQKNAAEGLWETNAVYKLDISGEGWTRMEAEKKQRTDEKGNPMTDGKLEQVAADMEPSVKIDAEDTVAFHPITETQEVMSLAFNMTSIEVGIAGAFAAMQESDRYGAVHLRDGLMSLGMALNAYGQKQREAIQSGRDTYLQGLCDRLDQMEQSNPLVRQIRGMIDATMHGREIRVWDDDFQNKAMKLWKEYHDFGDLTEEAAPKAEELFNEKTAMYCYMQKLARWQAERDGDLVEEMTGADDEEKKNHAVGEILRDTSMEDGLQAIREHRDRVRKCQHEDGTDLTEEEWDQENEQELLYAAGYDWNVICKQYLKENPDVAAVFAAYGDPYKTNWN